MEGAWSTAHGRLALVGTFRDVNAHQHPAVQISVRLGDGGHVHTASGALRSGPLLVIASGVEHALHTGATPTLAIYLRPDDVVGAQLNESCRHQVGTDGVWSVDIAPEFTVWCRESIAAEGIDTVVDRVLDELVRRRLGAVQPVLHPQLLQAVELLYARVPQPVDLVSLAREVALSPDYLGRLFARQTGASYALTARWIRLLTAFDHVTHGASVTDAAHRAGFADSAHATRVCRELTGAVPRDLLRALQK